MQLGIDCHIQDRAQVDFIGATSVMRHFGQMMVDRGKGAILNTTSQTAIAGGENRAAYATAKAAVSQLILGAAVDLPPMLCSDSVLG